MQFDGMEFLPELPALPGEQFDRPSARDYIHSSGMPHRSGEVGGRHDGTHLTAREMAELQRNGRLEQMIRRLQRARASMGGVEARFAAEEPEMPAPYDPNF